MDSIAFHLRFQRRKSIGLYVLADASVEVRAPHGTSRRVIGDFVKQHEPWLRQRLLQRLAQNHQHQQRYRPGGSQTYLGRQLPLVFAPAGRWSVHLAAEEIRVRGPATDDPERVARALENWFVEQARMLFQERVTFWLQHPILQGLRPAGIKVRRMKTRWGSCSSRGSLNFNVSLLHLGVEQIDCVVVHELCHLLEFSHNPRFYALMDGILPAWRDYEKALKRMPL